MARWVILVVLAGCGFRSSDLPTDASAGGSDSGTDTGGTSDGPGSAPGCWQHWLDGNVNIAPTSVQPITELSGTTDDRWPWISDNGLRLYFSRNPGPRGMNDIVQTDRTTLSDPFGLPAEVPNLNTSTAHEIRAWFTADQLTLVLSTNKDNVNQFDIHFNTRNPTDMFFGTPDGTYMSAVNSTGSQHYDPFLSADCLRLYLSANTGPGGKLQIVATTRASTTANFPAPSPVDGVNGSSSNAVDPTLYQDEHVIVFATFPQSTTNADLWYASRADPVGRFNPPIQIPNVNTSGSNADPVLSKDGCELYFASNRGAGGKYHLFHAQVIK